MTTTPAVLVLDSFNAGGNQAALRQDRMTREASLTQIVSYADEWQTLRGGVQVDLLRLNEQRQTNHGGTFVFGSVIGPDGSVVATPLERYLRTVRGVPGYGPSSFSIARGEPSIGFDDWQISLFFQDDIDYVRQSHIFGRVSLHAAETRGEVLVRFRTASWHRLDAGRKQHPRRARCHGRFSQPNLSRYHARHTAL